MCLPHAYSQVIIFPNGKIEKILSYTSIVMGTHYLYLRSDKFCLLDSSLSLTVYIQFISKSY